MTTEEQIKNFIASQSEPKRSEVEKLHSLILGDSSGTPLWFSDGKNEDGKTVANPTIGYGSYTIHYANGDSKDCFQIGLSTNKTGLSIYIMGKEDKTFLAKTCAALGKATVTGYCIRFKSIADIDLAVLQAAIRYGFETETKPLAT